MKNFREWMSARRVAARSDYIKRMERELAKLEATRDAYLRLGEAPIVSFAEMCGRIAEIKSILAQSKS